MVIRCDCGFRAAGESETELVIAAQVHAGDAHSVELAADTILGLLHRGRPVPCAREEGDTV